MAAHAECSGALPPRHHAGAAILRRLALCLLCGCGGVAGAGLGEDAAERCGPGDPPLTLTVGSSETGFVALADDGLIQAYAGMQGGFHVYLSLRATHVDPGTRQESPRRCSDPGDFRNPCLEFDVFDLDDQGRQVDTFVALRYPLSESAPGVYDLVPPRLVTLAVKSLDEIDGHHLRVKASVVDASCHAAERELTVTCTAVR